VVRVNLVKAYLNYVVVAHYDACGLEIEENDGFGQVEFHECELKIVIIEKLFEQVQIAAS
jgi:hypothetical protein